MTRSNEPGIHLEESLFARGCVTVCGIDEVGRGAWAGPIGVGIAMVTRPELHLLPAGVRDSKQLTPKARSSLFEPLVSSVTAYAVGFASPSECDAHGMTAAQRLATKRAFDQLPSRPDGVILDGRYNFTDRSDTVLCVKADQQSRIVAVASILAKVTRDRLMIDHAKRFPEFGFEQNKGYASLMHRKAVIQIGMTELHRQSWSFAQVSFDDVIVDERDRVDAEL